MVQCQTSQYATTLKKFLKKSVTTAYKNMFLYVIFNLALTPEKLNAVYCLATTVTSSSTYAYTL